MQQIKRRICDASGFSQCIGFVDGTLFPLSEKPQHDGEDYFSRKGCYGIAGLLVCDDNKRIRYTYTGWAGCAHDARVYANSALALKSNQLFAGQEYLLADSAYTPDPTIIPAFKRLPHKGLTTDETLFNFYLSNVRVRVEHCIGILKARFQSLRGLRLVIRTKNDVKRCVCWINACCVMHNLLLQDPINDEWLEGEELGGMIGDDEFDQANLGGRGAKSSEDLGRDLRNRVMRVVLAKHSTAQV